MSAETAVPATEGRDPAARKRLLLAVCCTAQFLVILDLSIVNVALPSIQAALLFSAADLQWVIDAYAIMFAGFLMLAGRAVDVLGHRRVFTAALLLFGVASLACGLAPSSGALSVARGLQGLAGAGMAAASLAIITSSFAAGPERARAIGLWGAMNGLGGAAGMLFGGILTEALSWRWVFLANAPVAFAAAVLAAIVVAERRGRRQSFDLLGALVLTTGLLIVTYGGVTAGSEGWTSAEALVPIAIGNILLALFPVIESRVSSPLVPPKAITRPLRNINLIVLLFSAALFPMWYVGSLYMQQVLALSPLETGLTFLPMALVIFACASQAGKLANRVGVRPVLGGGLLLMAAGLVLFAQISDSGSPIQYIVVPGVLTAMGIGFSIVPSTIAATQSAEASQAGLASGLVNSARQIGGGLGLVVLISIATQHTSGLIGDGEPAEEALTAGFSIAYYVGAGLTAAAALLTFLVIPRAHTSEQVRLGRRVVAAAGVVVVAFAAVGFGAPRSEDPPIGHFTMDGAQSFVSAPGLHPPELQSVVPASDEHPLPGYLMTANFYDLTKGPMVGQSGPLMLDSELQPVWFRPVPEDMVAGNLQVAEFDGEPVLTWWQGALTETGEVSSGEIVVVDRNYETVATLEGADGWIISLHELEIRDGVAWVTSNKNIRRDLSDAGGVSNGVLLDSAVQRYDLKSGELLSTWRATDHIDLEESETQPPPNGFPWDAYHVNSIDVTDDGKMLVSMRNTSAGYLIDVDSGEIEWRLGGKRSDFEIPEEGRFEWQHDLELKPGSIVTMFDNSCCEITGAGEYLPPSSPSHALEFKLDEADGTATLVNEWSHGATFNAQYMGNAQWLDDGRVFVGWGQVPYMTMYSRSGEIVFDAAFPPPNMSYRAYVQPWVGRPTDPPKCVARQEGGTTTVYASWNGATELARWKVLAGGETAAQKTRDGFETAIPVRGDAAGLTVQALDDAGQVLRTCRPAVQP